MSSIPLKFIAAPDLAKIQGPSVAVVDVRDEERLFDGHIAGSLYYASGTFEDKLSNLFEDIQNRDTVVFHCALSQIRGPNCARLFNEHLRQRAIAGKLAKLPRVFVLERGFNGWAGAGWPTCSCKESPCRKQH